MSRGLRLQDLAFLGRVGNAGVTPLSFPGLHRWYKADSFVANDGDSIGGGTNTRGAWIDQTGSGDNANVGSGGPVYRTNIVGTMPVIRFLVATGPFLNFAPGSLNNFTVVAACRSPLGSDSFLFYATGTGHQLRRSFGGTNHLFFFNGATATSANFATNNFMVAGCKRSGAAVDFRENLTSRGSDVAAGAWAPTQIGFFSGQDIDMGELMIYNTTLSEANLDQLYNEYLKPRWVTLP